MSSIRQKLKRLPLAVHAYVACKNIAHSIFPPDQFARHGSDHLDGQQSAKSAADFNIYHQYPPHVLSTFQEKDMIVREALNAYSSVSVADEPSGLYTDPNRVLNFFQNIEAANKLAPGDYLELGSHRGFSLRVIYRFMDPSRTLYSLDTFEGFDERDIAVEQTKYATSWTAGSFARPRSSAWPGM